MKLPKLNTDPWFCCTSIDFCNDEEEEAKGYLAAYEFFDHLMIDDSKTPPQKIRMQLCAVEIDGKSYLTDCDEKTLVKLVNREVSFTTNFSHLRTTEGRNSRALRAENIVAV